MTGCRVKPLLCAAASAEALRLRSVLFGSSYGAGSFAVAAADAGVGIDDILVVALADSADRAFGSAGAALDAFVGNFISHDVSSFGNENMYKSLIISQRYSIIYSEIKQVFFRFYFLRKYPAL